MDSSNVPMIFAGTPPTTLPAGTSFVTTEPAATIEFSPMVTPYMIVLPPPHKNITMDFYFAVLTIKAVGAGGPVEYVACHAVGD